MTPPVPMDEAVELEPCPFCSETDQLGVSDTGQYWVTCEQCYTEGPTAPTRRSAIHAWNTRAAIESSGVQEMAEALAALLAHRHDFDPDKSLEQVEREARAALTLYRGETK